MLFKTFLPLSTLYQKVRELDLKKKTIGASFINESLMKSLVKYYTSLYNFYIGYIDENYN